MVELCEQIFFFFNFFLPSVPKRVDFVGVPSPASFHVTARLPMSLFSFLFFNFPQPPCYLDLPKGKPFNLSCETTTFITELYWVATCLHTLQL